MENELEKRIEKTYHKDIIGNIEADIPNNALIEVTNACNLRCGMCANRTMVRTKGLMEMETYQKVIDQLKEMDIENVGLYTTGEAFLHPRIFDFIDYAKQKEIEYLYVTTNGQLLDQRKAESLLETKLDSIKFSIDAGTKVEYESVREGGNFERLIENIKYLKERRDEKGSTLRIYGSYIVRDDKKDDLDSFMKNINPFLDEVYYSKLTNQGGQSDIIEGKRRENPCILLWDRMIINYDGSVTMCCIDFDNQLEYGDTKGNTLKEIWNNEKIKEARGYHLNKRFEELPLCENCTLEE